MLYNQISNMDAGISSYNIWERYRYLPTKEIIRNCNNWVCPAYGLKPKLHKSGVKIPK